MLDLTALENLHFKDVFLGTGIDDLLEGVSHIQDYLAVLFESSTHSTIWITDNIETGHCIFVTDTNGINKDKLLKVINHNAKSLFLWHVDGVMFEHLSKCDCALLHDRLLHLVEFKANAITENPESIEQHYEKAQTQLKLTFDRFKELYEKKGYYIFDIFDDIDAQIVFDRKIPQDSAYQKSLKNRFLDENEIILSFGNEWTIK